MIDKIQADIDKVAARNTYFNVYFAPADVTLGLSEGVMIEGFDGSMQKTENFFHPICHKLSGKYTSQRSVKYNQQLVAA